jgi:hypothetical protein
VSQEQRSSKMYRLTRVCKPSRAGFVHSGTSILRTGIRPPILRPIRLLATDAAPPKSSRPKIPIEPRPRSRFLSRTFLVVKYTGYAVFSSAFGILLLGAGIFIHDAFTYTNKHIDRVPVSPLALHPERGGPKNLPVVRALVDDVEDDQAKSLLDKPKLVIVGGGWGVRANLYVLVSLLTVEQAVSVLDTLSFGDYHVTVVTPETFTTFTPLLPCECRFGILETWLNLLMQCSGRGWYSPGSQFG